jgi:hypothetical protein
MRLDALRASVLVFGTSEVQARRPWMRVGLGLCARDHARAVGRQSNGQYIHVTNSCFCIEPHGIAAYPDERADLPAAALQGSAGTDNPRQLRERSRSEPRVAGTARSLRRGPPFLPPAAATNSLRGQPDRRRVPVPAKVPEHERREGPEPSDRLRPQASTLDLRRTRRRYGPPVILPDPLVPFENGGNIGSTAWGVCKRPTNFLYEWPIEQLDGSK